MQVTKAAALADAVVPAEIAVSAGASGKPVSVAPLIIGLASAALAMVCTFQGLTVSSKLDAWLAAAQKRPNPSG